MTIETIAKDLLRALRRNPGQQRLYQDLAATPGAENVLEEIATEDLERRQALAAELAAVRAEHERVCGPLGRRYAEARARVNELTSALGLRPEPRARLALEHDLGEARLEENEARLAASQAGHGFEVRQDTLVRELRDSADPRLARFQRELRQAAYHVMGLQPREFMTETEVPDTSPFPSKVFRWVKQERHSTASVMASCVEMLFAHMRALDGTTLRPLSRDDVTRELERIRADVMASPAARALSDRNRFEVHEPVTA